MLKKLLWLTMLVLITACTVYVSGGGLITVATPTPVVTQITTEVTVTSETATEVATEITEVATDVTEVATDTAEPTATEISVTETPQPTATEQPTATSVPTEIPTATATATSIPMAYAVQPSTPVYMVNFAHTDAGCSWQGVAGQVFDATGAPLKNYIVKVTGTYNGSSISMLGVTGMVSGNPYGPGSYEIILGTTAIDSTDLLSIQVFDPSGNAITDPVKFSTSSTCSKNLIIINFVKS